MKVDFLPTFTPQVIRFKKVEHFNPVNNENFEINNIYYRPISFTALPPVTNELKTSENLHCPCCGIEMLQEDKIEDLMCEVENIKTSKEFIEYLHKNKKLISPIFKATIKMMEDICQNDENIELLHLLNIARASNSKHAKNVMAGSVTYLQSEIESGKYGENDLNLIKQCKQNIESLLNSDRKLITFESYITAIREPILQMESQDKYQIYGRIQNSAVKALLVRNALYISNVYEKEKTTPAYAVIRNMLGLNKIQTRPVVKSTPKYNRPDNVYNGIALCQKCFSDGSINKLLARSNEDYVRLNFNRYLEDVANEIIKGRMQNYKHYPTVLRGMLRIYEIDKNDYIFSDVAFELKQKIFDESQSINSELPFINNLPCACCGKKTISHEQKLLLFEEIVNAKTDKELLDIMNRNSELIRDKYMPIYRDFKEKLEKSPWITNSGILKSLRIRATGRLERKIFECANIVKCRAQQDNLSAQDMEKINEFVDLLEKNYRNLSADEEFVFAVYNNIIDRTLGQLEYERKHNYIFKMKKAVKKLVVSQQALFPLDKTIKKFDNPLKVVIQDIFKGACATKDHIVAKQRGGSDARSNLLILCKDCNKDKTNNAFEDWFNKNPNVSINLQKQVDFIKAKIQTGELDESMFGYLEEMAKNVEKLSDGVISLKV